MTDLVRTEWGMLEPVLESLEAADRKHSKIRSRSSRASELGLRARILKRTRAVEIYILGGEYGRC
jgi:hypothetical protein